MALILLFFMATVPAETFSSFSFCRENSRGPYEFQCVELNAEGKGEVRFKRRDADPTGMDVELSPGARDRFLGLIAATNYLADGHTYESSRRVADLGLKTVQIELPEGTRKASFNFSQMKEVAEMTAFFENLINQEMIRFDVDTALQFERLSVPKRLDQIENELRSRRLADPHGLIPLLEAIENDERLMNFARTQAARLKQQIESLR